VERFCRRRYEATSLPDLVAATGSSRQSVCDTFANKRAPYIGEFGHYRATRVSHAMQLLERDASPVDDVRASVRFFESPAADAH